MEASFEHHQDLTNGRTEVGKGSAKDGKELNGLRNAIAALGHRAKPAKKIAKKRGMSAATRKKIAAAQKARWAKVRAKKRCLNRALHN